MTASISICGLRPKTLQVIFPMLLHYLNSDMISLSQQDRPLWLLIRQDTLLSIRLTSLGRREPIQTVPMEQEASSGTNTKELRMWRGRRPRTPQPELLTISPPTKKE